MVVSVVTALFAAAAALAQAPSPAAAPQNPSPMVETTRAHERLPREELDGATRSFAGPGGKSVELFLPAHAGTSDTVHLVIHFHGASWIAHQSVARVRPPAVAAVVNLGAGSALYHQTFANPVVFDSLLGGVARAMATVSGREPRVGRLTLTGFSAGHGAIRAILRHPRHFAAIDAVLLLDGMHTSYIPERTVLEAGGVLDTTHLTVFAELARAAVRGEKRFVVTHSEIFPGTFASTTETADWLLRAVGLRRTPVLHWGPRGMQQLSESRAGRFELLGFAGNTGPDHIDHLHALPEMLGRVAAP